MIAHNFPHPHRLYLPGSLWDDLTAIAQVTSGFEFTGSVVTHQQAQNLVKKIDSRDLPRYIGLLFELDLDDASREWISGDGCEERSHVADEFFAGGGFTIVRQDGGVLLVR